MNNKAVLIKTIDRIQTKAAYDAAADIVKLKAIKRRIAEDMETALKNNNMRWYQARKKAAEACDQQIEECLKICRAGKPAKNKAGAPGMKTKDGGQLIRIS